MNEEEIQLFFIDMIGGMLKDPKLAAQRFEQLSLEGALCDYKGCLTALTLEKNDTLVQWKYGREKLAVSLLNGLRMLLPGYSVYHLFRSGMRYYFIVLSTVQPPAFLPEELSGALYHLLHFDCSLQVLSSFENPEALSLTSASLDEGRRNIRPETPGGDADIVIQKAMSYIQTHFQDDLTREDVADASMLSSSRALLSALLFALFCAILLIAFLFSLRSVKPIRNLLALLQNPQNTLSRDLYNDREICYIADQITSYIQQNQMLSDELTARLSLLNETKLLALQSQINPHFLFNTLNTIHIQESEALGYDHKIPKITLSLSRLLRYAIESTDLVSLETELNFTKMYVSILQERYGGKLNVIYDIRPDALKARVPKLFVQPIIENAIFHGLAENMDEHSTLTLFCRQEDSLCAVTVSDNGAGMSADTLARLRAALSDASPMKGSIGLKNTVTRMNLLYGESFSISIDSTPDHGSTFTLRFPFIQ